MSDTGKKLAACLISLVITFTAMAGLFALPGYAAPAFTTGVVTGDDLRLRDAAGTGGSVLGYLKRGTVVQITGQADVASETWYAVTCFMQGVSVSGWCHGGFVTPVPEDPAFEDYLTAQGFPEDYKPQLRALHTLYPAWVFEAVQTNLKWADVCAAESVTAKNLVPRSSDAAYINGADVDANGNQLSRDGYAWVSASAEAVAYYMDPRNWLTDPYIFQFESLAYSPACHTEAGVSAIIAGTFMDTPATWKVGEVDYTYLSGFMKAAEVTGASPYHLASRVRMEQSNTGTVLSAGIVAGHEGFYNLFNYGAYTTSSASATVNGAIYASRVGADYYGPWTSPIAALLGGAKMLAEGYIAIGQNTLYFQKFNVVTANPYSHQYMTNVMAPSSESATMKSAYSAEMLQTALAFRIPVYLEMSSAPTSRPLHTTPTFGTNYVISPGHVGGIAPGTSVAAFRNSWSVSHGVLRVLTASGSVKSAGTIATGDVVQILYGGGTTVYAAYSIVIIGDVRGDGAINVADLLCIQRHLLGSSTEVGAFLLAADVTHDGAVNIVDLLKLQRCLLGSDTITQ